MTNELTESNAALFQNLMNFEFLPSLYEEGYPDETYTKLPISRIAALGTGLEPFVSAIQKAVGSAGGASGLYKVTVPKGTHLATYKNGVGNLGTALSANNQIAGQAVLTPLHCDPSVLTSLCMAATLVIVDKKLDTILGFQQEILDFLKQDKKAELRGNLIFLSDILKNYRFNWNNETYRNTQYTKVQDIRQTSEQNILLFRDQLLTKIKKKDFIHSDKSATKQIEKVRSDLREYQLALFTYGFSYFLEVMLLENFDTVFLNEIKLRLNDYSVEYRKLYSVCFDEMKAYFDSTIQSSLLKGLKIASTATGEAITKVPVLSKSSADESLIEAGEFLDRFATVRTNKQMKRMLDRQDSCVTPFIENIEEIGHLYNDGFIMLFDKDTVFLRAAQEA